MKKIITILKINTKILILCRKNKNMFVDEFIDVFQIIHF
jgi:hypothetical protein